MFTVPALEPGTYTIEVSLPGTTYPRQYLGGYRYAPVTPVPGRSFEVGTLPVELDMEVHPYRTLTGTVVGDVDLGNVGLVDRRNDPMRAEDWATAAMVSADAEGHFIVTQVAGAENHAIQVFGNGVASGYLHPELGTVPTLSMAASWPGTALAQGLTFRVFPAREIHAEVEQEGEPSAGKITLHAWDGERWEPLQSVTWPKSSFTQLPPGRYTLAFEPGAGAAHPAQWLGGHAFPPSPDDPAVVVVDEDGPTALSPSFPVRRGGHDYRLVVRSASGTHVDELLADPALEHLLLPGDYEIELLERAGVGEPWQTVLRRSAVVTPRR